MKKKLLCLLFLIGFGYQAHAVPVISIDPSFENTSIGGEVSVDITVSGLGDDILTAWDLDLFYDDTLLQLDSVVFGTGLDVLGLGSIQDVFDFGFGWVNLFEVSLDFDEDLMLFQPDSFVLATLTFTGLDFGISALDIAINSLAGEYVFDDLLGYFVAKELQADVQGGAIEVPEPGTVLLFLCGLLGIGMRRNARTAAA